MSEIFLAFVLFGVPAIYPQVIPMDSIDKCHVQAEKLNKEDPDVRAAAAQKAEWVCLKVARRSV